MMTMRGGLLVPLLAQNTDTPKIIPAKRMLAEWFVMRGLYPPTAHGNFLPNFAGFALLAAKSLTKIEKVGRTRKAVAV